MIIDAHMHIGKKEFCSIENTDLEYDLFNDYEDALTVMNNAGIDKSVIFPVPYYQVDVAASNDYVYKAYQKYPDRFIPFCRIDEKLEENLVSGKFKGVKLHLLYEQIEIKSICKQLQIIEDACVPLVVHARFSDKVKQVEKMLKYAPNLIIILAHMGRGHLYTGEQVIENAVGLRKHSNVYFDLSTVEDKKAIINACEIIGYDHVLYASDYPFGKAFFKQNYDYVKELHSLYELFDEKQKELVFHGNIERILALQEPETIKIRRAKKKDYSQIVSLLESIDERDKKYLALKNKYSQIKQVIKSERHCYVAFIDGQVAGFLRESGRPDNFSLLEEIVVSPEHRGKGIASRMLGYFHNTFRKSMAKTNAENVIMIRLLKKNGYIALNPDAPRIINWQRIGE